LLFFHAYGKYFLLKYAIIQCFVASRLRACKGFHQSAASAKLNPELRLFIEPEKGFINRLRAPN
jgi:hypothetical protein